METLISIFNQPSTLTKPTLECHDQQMQVNSNSVSQMTLCLFIPFSPCTSKHRKGRNTGRKIAKGLLERIGFGWRENEW